MHDQLCASGPRCEDRQPATNPETGEKAYLGAAVEQDTPLCATCIRYTRYALGSAHLDVAELTTLMAPSMQVHYRDPGLPDQPRVKLYAPLPFNGQAEALRARIDHEVSEWAEAVADATGGHWDPAWADMTRIGHRVQASAAFLVEHTLSLVTLPTERRRVFSTGLDASAGHDDADTYHGAAWAERSGADAALVFLSLHEQVRRMSGRVPSTRIAFPCPHCHQRNLHREHHKALTDPRTGEESQGRVVCRTCWQQWSDAGYEELRAATARAFGVAI